MPNKLQPIVRLRITPRVVFAMTAVDAFRALVPSARLVFLTKPTNQKVDNFTVYFCVIVENDGDVPQMAG